MEKGTLTLIDNNGDEIQFYSETSADMVKHNHAGTETTVAALLNSLLAGDIDIEALDEKQDKSDILTGLSNLTLSADKLILATGENSFSTTALTSTGKSIISSYTDKDIRKALGIYRHLVLDEIETTRWGIDGTPTISNVNAKFDKALQLAQNRIYRQDLSFDSGNFSVDFWGYIDSACPQDGVMFTMQPEDWTINGVIFFGRDALNSDIRIGVYTADGSQIFNETVGFNPIGTLNHYEIDYNYGAQNFKFFINGNLVLEKNSVNIEKIARWVLLGDLLLMSNTVNYPFIGAISEFRISDCVRHSANFTPPTEKYEVDENTISLLHFD